MTQSTRSNNGRSSQASQKYSKKSRMRFDNYIKMDFPREPLEKIFSMRLRKITTLALSTTSMQQKSLFLHDFWLNFNKSKSFPISIPYEQNPTIASFISGSRSTRYVLDKFPWTASDFEHGFCMHLHRLSRNPSQFLDPFCLYLS